MTVVLNAFPLTPIADDRVDEAALVALVERLVAARVDAITVLGSTGSYVYLDRAERARVTRLAVEHAGDVPVMVGVGHVRTREVLALVDDAQAAGVAGVLLAPVTYQPLKDDEVVGLFAEVDAHLSVPLIVYDNPRTTHVTFTDEMHARISALPSVAGVKLPPDAIGRVDALRSRFASVGISGDAAAVAGLDAGCDVWYSVVGGILPEVAQALVRDRHPERFEPLWDLFARYGSVRVVAALAESLGLARRSCLPRPLLGLDDDQRREVDAVVVALADG